jgi:hypothetical protein
MAYTLTYSGGNITVNDGTLNTANTSLALPGRNYAGYGRPIDQNMVSLLENFASTVSAGGPTNPIKGQIWYDPNLNTLKYNSSNTATATWQTVATQGVGTNATFGTVTTTGLTTGGSAISGTITGNWTIGVGSRIQATYTDLAERFAADDVYESGTVVELGGDQEVTAVREDLSDKVFGVVSSTAAYLLNSGAGDDRTHPAIAMTGRVNVNVRGEVKKGDRLVSAGSGLARAARPGEANSFTTVGRALADKLDSGVGPVLAAVQAKL